MQNSLVREDAAGGIAVCEEYLTVYRFGRVVIVEGLPAEDPAVCGFCRVERRWVYQLWILAEWKGAGFVS